MANKQGLTLAEVVFVVLLVTVVGLLLYGLIPSRDYPEARRIRCRGNLNQLAKGMATYLNEHGGNRWYSFPLGLGRKPNDFNGAEWLASLYWSSVVPDPGVFICPSSPDTSANGRDLGTFRAAATFGSQTVSYAGMHYRSLTDQSGKPMRGAIPDDFPPNMPMASDDTQGAIHHGEPDNGGMCILFFDSHCEFRTHTELDLERAVGQKGGLLWQLRN